MNDDAKYVDHTVRALGMSSDGEILNVQSLEPKEAFKMGGAMHGYRYEWGFNHYSFTENKECVMKFIGLTEAEYDHYDNLFVFRYNKEKEEWYRSAVAETYKEMIK